MKDFLKTLLAVIIGFGICLGVLFVLCFGIIGTIVSIGSSSSSVTLPKEGVLKIDLSSFSLGEQGQEANPFASFTGGDGAQTIGLWDAVRAINLAAEDPTVQYIYMTVDGNGSSLASLEELRKALAHFKSQSGKSIVSYMESPSTASYYIASVSDKIYMTSYEGASSSLIGVGTQGYFLGDLLKKLGVNMQLIRHGKYKSAGEMYTRSSSSAENLEQRQRMVDSIWESLAEDICSSRDISKSTLDSYINDMTLCLPQDFLDCGMVDELLSRKELEDKLATLAVKDDFKSIRMFSLSDYISARITPNISKNKIAVIYANGEINDGSARQEVAGDRFAGIISKVCADSSVKAVVLRVNSPGGSVLASEKIKHELDLLGATKPLVASYGDYAASGGYWISNNCYKIYSDRTTLTGSIGVFGLIPDFSKTASDILHVGVEVVGSHKHAGMYSGMKPLDATETAYMQHSIETIYDLFTTTVSQGRSLPKERVDEIGQGRVWTGADALGLGLVDEIGTLEDAINYAAFLAGDADLSNWSINAYPNAPSTLDSILDLLGSSSDSEDAMVKIASRFGIPTNQGIYARMDTNFEIK